MFSLLDYDFELPQDFISQAPANRRDRSRLLMLDRKTGGISHHAFCDLVDILLPSDVLVINNTEVIPGRLYGRKESGGKAEVLILDYAEGRKKQTDKGAFECACLVKASKRLRTGAMLLFDHGLRAEVLGFQDGVYTLRFLSTDDFETLLYRIGDMPLPPYIKRGEGKETPCDDRTSYQTIYASQKGAVAAPTAGLHFSGDIFDKLKSKGILVAEITLHVGYGTFLPVRVSDIRDHRMHSEFFSISGETADLINHARKEGRRIVAVGTTTVRTLEYASDTDGHLAAGTGNCDLFIYPGYKFKAVDAMITNFHLPKSTLLMLVSALAGRTGILNAYQEAIRNKYRFYSYGDAMLIV
jgi:S-adenosylmethionine:tRNA ribosyltransferase-isomerase